MATLQSYLLLLTFTQFSTSDDWICPVGWSNLLPDTCVFLHEEPRTWTEAKDVCLENHGHLLVLDPRLIKWTVIDHFALDILANYLTGRGIRTFWSSLHVRESSMWWYTEAPYIMRQYEGDLDFTWSEGQRYEHINESYCGLTSLSSNGLEISLQLCRTAYSFICMSQRLDICFIEDDNGCERNWYRVMRSDICISPFFPEMTFNEAEQICRANQGFLFGAEDPYKQQILLRLEETNISPELDNNHNPDDLTPDISSSGLENQNEDYIAPHAQTFELVNRNDSSGVSYEDITPTHNQLSNLTYEMFQDNQPYLIDEWDESTGLFSSLANKASINNQTFLFMDEPLQMTETTTINQSSVNNQTFTLADETTANIQSFVLINETSEIYKNSGTLLSTTMKIANATNDVSISSNNHFTVSAASTASFQMDSPEATLPSSAQRQQSSSKTSDTSSFSTTPWILNTFPQRLASTHPHDIPETTRSTVLQSTTPTSYESPSASIANSNLQSTHYNMRTPAASSTPRWKEISCLQCGPSFSEEECNAKAETALCAGFDPVCKTVLVFYDASGGYLMAKHCESNSLLCSIRDPDAYFACLSPVTRMGYLQQTLQQLVCTFCCLTHNCNEEISSDLQILSMQRIKRSVQTVNVPGAVWLGLRINNGVLSSWTNGQPFLSSSFGIPVAVHQHGCLISQFQPGNFPMMWQTVNCSMKYSVLCEKRLEKAKLIINTLPNQVQLISREFDPHSPLYNPNLCLTCDTEGITHNELIASWEKDGVTIKYGKTPLLLNLSSILQNIEEVYGTNLSLGSIQGYYKCFVRDQLHSQEFKSNSALVTFRDVLTYRLTLNLLQLNLSVVEDMKHAMLTHNHSHAYLALYYKMLKMLLTLNIGGVEFVPDIEIHDIRSKQLLFSTYYTLPNLADNEWELLLESISLQYYTTVPGEKLTTLLDRLQTRVISLISAELDSKLEDNYRNIFIVNRFNLLPKSKQDFTIRSTVGCSDSSIIRNGMRVDFKGTHVEQLVYSEQVCIQNGRPYGTLKCLGNFINGVTWGDVTWYEDCQPIEGSIVTEDLYDLTQRDMDDAVYVAAKLANLSSYPLSHPDVVYSSYLLMSLAEQYKPSLKMGSDFVLSISNIMTTDPKIIAQAQNIGSGPARILEAIEIFTRTVNMDFSSREMFCSSYLCIVIHTDVGDASAPLGQGILVPESTESEISRDQLQIIEDTKESPMGDLMPGSGLGESEALFEPAHDEDASSRRPRLEDMIDSDTGIMLPEEIMSMVNGRQGSGSFHPAIGRGGNNQGEVDIIETILGLFMNHRLSRLTFSVFSKSDIFVSKETNNPSKSSVNSRVIASTVNGYRMQNLTDPVYSTFRMLKGFEEDTHHCVWWDFEANNATGGWSEIGCWTSKVVDDRIICACNHLTNFAILAQVRQEAITSRTHHKILSTLSIIGLTLSLCGTGVTIVSFLIFKRMRKGRSQRVLFNLALSLFVSNIVFIFGISKTNNHISCMIVAVLLHYFILASFSWMLVEAVVLYLKFVKLFNQYVGHFMLKAAVPAWGFPAVIVALTLILENKDYLRSQEKLCWLNFTLFYFAFLLPVVCVIITNFILFSMVIKAITCSRPKGLNSTQTKKALWVLRVKSGLCSFVLLGFTWVFGFLAIEDAAIPLQYIFCICNTLQGCLIFISHILRNRELRNLWFNLFATKKTCRTNSHSGSSLNSTKKNKSQRKTGQREAPSCDKTEKGLKYLF